MSRPMTTDTTTRFAPGDIICYRYSRDVQPRFVMPVRVIDDREDATVLFMQEGTTYKAGRPADGSTLPRNTPYAVRHGTPHVASNVTWAENHMLMILKPGWPFDIRLFWRATTGAFRGWYVNIQDPVVRWEGGFDSMDHQIDVTVAPDRSWALKDEDELADAVTVGRYTQAQAERFRAQAEDAITTLIEPWAWPFNAGFEHAMPDPLPDPPHLPATWNAPMRRG